MAEFQLIDETITLIEELEGCKLIAYEDVTGYAIGYGSHKHLDGRNVKKGDKITQEDAIKLLKQRVENEFFPHTKRILTNSEINSYQAGAVTSLIYNCGTGNITSERSVIKAINANPKDPKIKDLFAEWRLSGGKVCEGLCKRRAREYEFYDKQKINMNVSYVYNSNLGGYNTNSETDAVVGNSKNETKYINTNYCASIKCYDEPEPVVINGDYENDNAIVNNPLVYKGNEAISIVNSILEGKQYGFTSWVYEGLCGKTGIWFRRRIHTNKSMDDVVGVQQVYIYDNSTFETYINPRTIDIKKIERKINQHVNIVNKDFQESNIPTRFNEIDIGNGKYVEKLTKLRQYIIENSDLTKINELCKDSVEDFYLFCIEKSKLTANVLKFEKNTWPVILRGLSHYVTSEHDKCLSDGDNDSILKENTWDKKCKCILRVTMHGTFTKKKDGIFLGVVGVENMSSALMGYFNLHNKAQSMFLIYFIENNRCVVFNSNKYDTFNPYYGAEMYRCKKK